MSPLSASALVCLALAAVIPAAAADAPPVRRASGTADRAVIAGKVTTANRQVLLPGVEVQLLRDADGRLVATTYSDAGGQYRFDALPAGQYRIRARLPGFSDGETAPVSLEPAQKRELDLALELARFAQEVIVAGQAGIARADEASSAVALQGRMADVLPVASDGYRTLLPVLPGVVRQADGRISVKGARPTQGALSIGGGSGVDPSTGNFAVELPSDAVESVEVVPNPYAAEDGRFSSGLVRVETRAGSNTWRATVNTFVPAPCLKVCDGYSPGIQNYGPRGWFGGPLVKDRVFLSQAAEYRLAHARIPSLPDPENQQRSDSLDAFTRVDVRPATGHALTLSAAFFPRRLQNATLNTFNPLDVTPDFHSSGYSLAAAESATLAPTVLLTSFVGGSLFDASVTPHNALPMDVTVDGNRGGYFNRQHRRTSVVQWSETLTLSRPSAVGDHLVKLGVNLLRASYAGQSESRAVIVRRADGTASWRLDYGPPTAQHAAATDVALFAQDHWRLSSRWLVEAGARLDHDGLLGSTALAPRAGFVIGVAGPETVIVKGGAGLFYERSPLNVAAFESLEAATVTRFAADGVTPAGARLVQRHVSVGLQTPRAWVWNLELDTRLGPHVFVKLNHLRRSSSREFIVSPASTDASSSLVLSSGGKSEYRETEATVRIGASDERQVTCSYVRSHAVGSTNAYDLYFGTYRSPIVQPDEYALAPVDVPNRLLVRAVVPVLLGWTATSLLEIREGFPYSAVDEDQAFVGARNSAGRFPHLVSLDVGVVRAARVLKREVRLGMRVTHLLNGFAPRDVQNNVDSSSFGAFSNGLIRRITFWVQLTSR